MVILPDTNSDGALQIAEGMRAEVEALAIEHVGSEVAPHVTISLGVVTQIPQNNTAISHLIGAADRTMYRAKHSGRNCVITYGDNVSAAVYVCGGVQSMSAPSIID